MSSPNKDYVSDRGFAKYFHGREEILSSLNDQLAYAKTHQKGAIFLIQGSPGAGKTALLHECCQRAKKAEWEVATMEIPYFWNLDSFKKEMQRSKEEPKVKKVLSDLVPSQTKLNLGVPGFGLSLDFDFKGNSLSDFLNGGQKPLVLVLDEAQSLKDVHSSEHKKEIVKNALDRIENGRFHRPIILLLGGLNQTLSVIQSLGVSRLKDGCTNLIGRLDREAEKKMIRDWLVRDGNAQGDITPWMERITLETSQWPQHIMSYIKVAVPYLIKNGGKLSDKGLNHVLTEGRKKKADFYERRLSGIDINDVELTAQMLIAHKNKKLGRRQIISFFNKKISLEESKDLFEHLLSRGVLHLDSSRSYSVPIPSMYTWLISQYGPTPKKSQASMINPIGDGRGVSKKSKQSKGKKGTDGPKR